MKEIEFRDKHVDTGDWIYGSYILPKHRQNIDERAAVDVDTLGQFIGLYDIDANKIFEGDIVRCTSSNGNSAVYVIQYEEEQLSYVFKTSITKHAYMYSLSSYKYIKLYKTA